MFNEGLAVTAVAGGFAAYIAWEFYGGRLKSAFKAQLQYVRIAAVGFFLALLAWFYFTDFGMFMNFVEAAAPEPLVRGFRSIGRPPAVTSIDRDSVSVPVPAPRHARNVTPQRKKRIAALQQWHCALCGELLDETYEVDHILALSSGGTNEDSNLRALCRPCHARKTADEREESA